MVQKVWSGLFLHQHHITLLKLRLVQSRCVKQEFNSSAKQTLAASNRRLGFVLLSVVLTFFIGIVIKRSLLG
ncbi:cytochrome oxidase small assembly protein [Polynucleobacter sp. AP-Nino-20-G2]|uniref:cytochrome oxidase small assembly protein n=1 Tax=Polynucleobacter sp. AP-Nino-20-G2 TaxID=2576917 RepID=UPI001BFE194C|nr:cytochrome oxidase small assembly protein [Polynucleobacter sp. AP-Nino-20-G2]